MITRLPLFSDFQTLSIAFPQYYQKQRPSKANVSKKAKDLSSHRSMSKWFRDNEYKEKQWWKKREPQK